MAKVAFLIRARLAVQLHPGPPSKSVNTRLFSHISISGISLKKPFCQPFVNFAFSGSHSAQGGPRLCS